MSRPVHFGVTLPQIKRSWTDARDAAIEFEQLGFDSLWVCDHVYGVPMPGLPILEAWTELAAVAAVTERAELGTLVTPPFLRSPAMLAKQIATLDQIAGGRVIAGLGAGWYEAEFRGYGAPFPPLRERHEALEETCEILRGMWGAEPFSFEGRHFRVEEVICEPKPPRRPPLLIGGGGERVLMGIAARHADIWNNASSGISELEPKIDALRRRCEEVGRPFEQIEISQQCIVILAADDEAAHDAIGKAKKVFGPLVSEGLEEHGIWGSPEGVVERMRQKIALGCTLFVMEFFGRDTREPARLFAEKVMPALRS